MVYLVLGFLVVALVSSAASFALLALLWKRERAELVGILIRLELFIVLVLLANLVGFILESSENRPDRRVLFLLMSIANIAVGGLGWQAASFAHALVRKARGPAFDAAFLAGIVVVYILSVFFSLSWGGSGGIAYDNSVGFRIPSIVSAIVSLYCVILVLARLKAVDGRWRRIAKGIALFFIAVDLLSIANETLPLARLLGLAQLPLSPFILVALNSVAIALAWRRLVSAGPAGPAQEIGAAGPAASGAPEPEAEGGARRDAGPLFDEESVALAADRLGRAYGLSAREREVSALLLSGTLNPEIAERLFISVFTVKNHVHSVFRKTGAESRIDLIRIANSLK